MNSGFWRRKISYISKEKCGEVGARRGECSDKLFYMIGLGKSRGMSRGCPYFHADGTLAMSTIPEKMPGIGNPHPKILQQRAFSPRLLALLARTHADHHSDPPVKNRSPSVRNRDLRNRNRLRPESASAKTRVPKRVSSGRFTHLGFSKI